MKIQPKFKFLGPQYLFLFILISILNMSCKSASYTPENYQGQIICFAEGGGFTGRVQSYCLLDNGKLFKEESATNSYTKIKSIPDGQTEQIFETYGLLKFDEIHLNSPGNIYYYIHKKHKLRDHKIQWGSKDEEAPIELVIFHANLMNLTKMQD